MKIETHIPPPTQKRAAKPIYVQHVRKIQPGQSMFFPDSEFEADLKQIAAGVRIAALRLWGSGNFATRITEDPDFGRGVRIWRLS